MITDNPNTSFILSVFFYLYFLFLNGLYWIWMFSLSRYKNKKLEFSVFVKIFKITPNGYQFITNYFFKFEFSFLVPEKQKRSKKLKN